MTSNSQFGEDIDQLILEEENYMKDNVESGDESIINGSKSPPQKKPYQRYTAEQARRLNELLNYVVFEKISHPDEDERKTLGEELGLHPIRVKYWFQNRRSQTKKKIDKTINQQLKEDNMKLRTDNEVYKHVLYSATCQTCGGPSPDDVFANIDLLKAQNAFMKDEISRITKTVEEYCGKGVLSVPLNSSTATSSASRPSET